MTAHALKGDRERCLASGMDDYLTKPIRPEILYAMLDGLIPAEHTENASVPVEAIIDWDAALEQMGGSEGTLRDMIPPFIEETGELLSELREAIGQQHMAEVLRLAHTIKGTAFCFAAEPTAAAALRLEMMGRNNNLTDADEACASLEREVERLTQALMEFAKTKPDSE